MTQHTNFNCFIVAGYLLSTKHHLMPSLPIPLTTPLYKVPTLFTIATVVMSIWIRSIRLGRKGAGQKD